MIAVAISVFVVFSIPSSPGDELTSSTSGPRVERIMSTPATLRPMALAALKAVRPFGGRQCDLAAGSAPMQVGAEFAVRTPALHRGDNAAPDDKGPDVGAFRFLMNS